MDIKANCCNNQNLILKKKISKKPKDEPNYFIKKYYRELVKCSNCNHYFNIHNYNMDKIYKEQYSKISHGDDLMAKLNNILSLKLKSDNYHRVNRIIKFIKNRKLKRNLNLLDIGSGFGIFPYLLSKKINLDITALEPDLFNSRFIKKKLKLKCITGFFNKNKIKKKFSFVTANKVIEHVKNPHGMTRNIYNILKKNGLFYIELPDARASEKVSLINREEFFLEHYHIFTKKSLTYMLKKNNFEILSLSSIKEPSGKFTLFAFAKKING